MASPIDRETVPQFESRKVITSALRSSKKENQASGFSGLEAVRLNHEALPDLDFSDITISVQSLGRKVPTPFCSAL